MKIFYSIVLAAAALLASSAYALDVDCVTPEAAARATGQGSDGVTMDEEMLKKRKQAREAEMARLKARYTARTESDTRVAAETPAAR